MYQQINLYQPIFRRQRQVFSASALLGAAGVAAAALLAVYAYGRWQLAELEAEAARVDARQTAFTAQLAHIDGSAGAGRHRGVEAEIRTLNAELLKQQALADALREHPLGARAGFSPYLAALARQHSDRLWLTKVTIDGATGAMELAGRSVDAAFVPEYLKRLGKEEALAGQRFDHLEIERGAHGGGVSFRVSSRKVEKPALGAENGG